jgi:hypothetical protein
MEQKQRIVSVAGSGHFTMTELCRDFACQPQNRPQVGCAPRRRRDERLGEHSRALKTIALEREMKPQMDAD